MVPDIGGMVEALVWFALVSFGAMVGAVIALVVTAFTGWSWWLVALPIGGVMVASLVSRRALA